MKTIVLRELKASRKNLLIWSGAMLGLVAIGAAEYPTVATSGEDLMLLIESLPRIVSVMFGMDVIPLDTPVGYYVCLYLWYCLVAFTYSAVLGATIVAKEERNRTVEFLFTKPFARKTIVTAKVIAAVVNLAIFTLVAWISTLGMLAVQIQDKNLSAVIGVTMLAMFIIQLVFFSLGLLASAVAKNHRKALSVATVSVFAAYILAVIIEYIGTLDFLDFITPFRYFTGPSLVESGFSLFYVLLSIVIILGSLYFTYLLYQKRDLRC